jgi:16S rRNA (guanine(966)-N(2))-methyltransferase RsmD
MSRIRITGGEWRSRLIQVADAPGLRPTPDRVRETLFNWLGQDLSGLTCLDAFAGSGILGFEAASRGAEKVVLLERDRKAFLALRKHAEQFSSSRIETICCDAVNFSPVDGAAGFDLLFLDPPYRQQWLERMAPRLPQLVKPTARLYVEAEAPLEKLGLEWGSWRVMRQGHAGQVFFHLLEQA